MEFKVPQKQLFKIGEVCEMMEVEPHTLRFWEKEFEDFNPQKNPMNQRVYRPRDIEIAYLIKKLLYQEGYTIEGARRQLKREIAKLDRDGNGFPQEEVLEGLRKILGELKEILTILKD
jgi:DNA-binding transcriptional MerR regulator